MIERCFGILLAPGRSVKHADMRLLELVRYYLILCYLQLIQLCLMGTTTNELRNQTTKGLFIIYKSIDFALILTSPYQNYTYETGVLHAKMS